MSLWLNFLESKRKHFLGKEELRQQVNNTVTVIHRLFWGSLTDSFEKDSLLDYILLKPTLSCLQDNKRTPTGGWSDGGGVDCARDSRSQWALKHARNARHRKAGNVRLHLAMTHAICQTLGVHSFTGCPKKSQRCLSDEQIVIIY